MELFFPPTIEEKPEPDPWGPPPEEKVIEEYLTDEDGNQYKEEYVEDEMGETKHMKRIYFLADGTPVDVLIDFNSEIPEDLILSANEEEEEISETMISQIENENLEEENASQVSETIDQNFKDKTNEEACNENTTHPPK